jgi:hypothetical protein
MAFAQPADRLNHRGFFADGSNPAIGIIYQQPLKKSKGRPLFSGGLNSHITYSYSDCCE